jgi:hypothetical protein
MRWQVLRLLHCSGPEASARMTCGLFYVVKPSCINSPASGQQMGLPFQGVSLASACITSRLLCCVQVRAQLHQVRV